MRKCLVVAFVSLAAGAVLSACIPEYTHGLERTPEARVLARSIGNAYDANPVRWNRDVRGDLVRARGKVGAIEANGSVVFSDRDTGGGKDVLICAFSDLDVVADLNTGMAIVIKGKVDSVVKSQWGRVEKVRLVQCRLVS